MTSALSVTVLNLVVTALSFIVNIVIASKFGAGKEMDVYVAATAVPLFLTALLTGSTGYALIPVMSEYRLKTPLETDVFVSIFINMILCASTCACLVGMFYSESIMSIVTPGFSNEKIRLASKMLGILLTSVLFTAVSDILSNLCYIKECYIFPFITRIIGPVVVLAFIYYFAGSLSTMSLAYATVISGVLQALALFYWLRRRGDFRYSPSLNLKHPGIRKTLTLMSPLFLGMIVYRIIPLFDRLVLSMMPDGVMSIFNYSSMMVTALPPLLVMGISVTVFPRLADHFNLKTYEGFRESMESAIKMILMVTLPVIIITMLHADDIVRVLLQRGNFDQRLVQQVASVLNVQILMLLPAAVGTILGQCLYALQQMKAVAIIATAESIIYMLLCYPLSRHFGILGFLAALLFYWYLSIIFSLALISQVLDWRPWGMLKEQMKIVVLAVAVALIIAGMKRFWVPFWITIPCTIILYYTGLKVFAASGELDLLEIHIRKFLLQCVSIPHREK